jgi:hypothetical protein
MENETVSELDYSGLLMNHLNRLSFVSTSAFIDTVNKFQSETSINPAKVGETALFWGTKYLCAIVPEELQDQEFKKEWGDIKAGNNVQKQFEKIRAIINLLHRQGMLISKKTAGKGY